MSEHTPGPWRVEPCACTPYCRSAAVVPVARAHDAIGSIEDAKLIAAAPDLLEACHAALNIAGAAKLGATMGAHEGLDVDYHLEKIRAAIRKATE